MKRVEIQQGKNVISDGGCFWSDKVGDFQSNLCTQARTRQYYPTHPCLGALWNLVIWFNFSATLDFVLSEFCCPLDFPRTVLILQLGNLNPLNL